MLTYKQKKICEEYSTPDGSGHVHCDECPLIIDGYELMCRANSHWDVHKKEWVADDEEER